MSSQDGTALYCLVHQLHLSSLFHGEGDMTKCYSNHLKLFQVIRRCVQKNEENVSTMLPPGQWQPSGPPIHLYMYYSSVCSGVTDNYHIETAANFFGLHLNTTYLVLYHSTLLQIVLVTLHCATQALKSSP